MRLRFRNGPGPALLAREVWNDIYVLTGDAGARTLIAAHPEWVEEIAVEADAPPDVDTLEDLRRILSP